MFVQENLLSGESHICVDISENNIKPQWKSCILTNSSPSIVSCMLLSEYLTATVVQIIVELLYCEKHERYHRWFKKIQYTQNPFVAPSKISGFKVVKICDLSSSHRRALHVAATTCKWVRISCSTTTTGPCRLRLVPWQLVQMLQWRKKKKIWQNILGTQVNKCFCREFMTLNFRFGVNPWHLPTAGVTGWCNKPLYGASI